MNCEACRDRLIEHIHQELDHAERVAVSTHLAECSRCALASCALRNELDDISTAHAERPRAAVAAAIRRELAHEFAPPWWRRLGAAVARPIPAYGAVAFGLIPFAVWAVVGSVHPRGGVDPVDRGVGGGEPRLQNYDASQVLTSRLVVF